MFVTCVIRPLVSCYCAPQYSIELILGLGTVVGKQIYFATFRSPSCDLLQVY